MRGRDVKDGKERESNSGENKSRDRKELSWQQALFHGHFSCECESARACVAQNTGREDGKKTQNKKKQAKGSEKSPTERGVVEEDGIPDGILLDQVRDHG